MMMKARPFLRSRSAYGTFLGTIGDLERRLLSLHDGISSNTNSNNNAATTTARMKANSTKATCSVAHPEETQQYTGEKRSGCFIPMDVKARTCTRLSNAI